MHTSCHLTSLYVQGCTWQKNRDFSTMTISAAATRSRTIPLQHQACHDCPHRYIPCNHPAIWFGKICIIQCKISPFLTCKFCYITAINRKPGKWDFIACKLNFTCIIPPFISLHHRLIDAFVAINFCVVSVACSLGFLLWLFECQIRWKLMVSSLPPPVHPFLLASFSSPLFPPTSIYKRHYFPLFDLLCIPSAKSARAIGSEEKKIRWVFALIFFGIRNYFFWHLF